MLSGMIKTDLNINEADSGSVYHALKNTDKGFKQFGEIYFSSVKKDIIKAWKLHKEMTLNLIVPVGKIQFCFFDVREQSDTFNETFKIVLSQKPYFRLSIVAQMIKKE